MKNVHSNPNIKPANRISDVSEYYFSKKLREIAELNAKGANIISLGIGGPDRPPHSSVIQTLCSESAKSETHGYQPYVGLAELRQGFADWYQRHFNVTLNPSSEIQPLIGSKEGILHITLAFVNPGDGVLVPNPGYPTYSSVSKLAEAEIFNYNLTEDSNWEPNFEELEKLPLDKIKLMWVNYPHMPTGKSASRELFSRIIEFGRKHNIIIVNDNPYSFILNDEQLSILEADGARDIAIEMNSLSKSHNMAGWRVGMLASNPQFIQWILKVKSNIDSGQFKPMMIAAAKALACNDEWYTELNATYASRRLIAEQIMDRLGCTYDSTQKGLFLWGKVPAEAVDAATLADRVLYEANVFITPGFIFGSNGDKYIRISLCATEQNMNIALERIKNITNI